MGLRRGLFFAALWLAALLGSARAATGLASPGLEAYDTEIEAFLARWQAPGAAVAVVRDGRLVLARGYGLAKPGSAVAMQPDTPMRIASVSKPITAAAVMRLVQDGALRLDAPVVPLLGLGPAADERLNRVTVRHLLEHTGGWDAGSFGDPLFMSESIARATGVASPPDTTTIARWMLGQPLQHEPGSRYVYSNFGYALLGLVISRASGQSYERYVQALLRRAGVGAAQLGRSLPQQRSALEATYAMPSGSPLVPSVFAQAPGLVPFPDGGFALEAVGAAGAWVMSAIDLAAFASALDGLPGRPDWLTTDSLTEMTRRGAHVPIYATAWYAKGWLVNASGHAWHAGSLPGTTSLIVRAANGFSWAVIVNQRPNQGLDDHAADLDTAMWRAFRATTRWPDGDLFASLQPPTPIDPCDGQANFIGDQLCLPLVELPGPAPRLPVRYIASLKLLDAASLTFGLVEATPLAGGMPPEENATRYDPATGIVSIPRVAVFDAGGVARLYRATLQVVPGAPGLQFRVTEAVLLPM